MASPSGIPQLGALSPGAHVGQLYRDQRDLLETIVPFFATGLAFNERCIWVTSEPLCADQARAALSRIVLDLAHREQRGQIEIVDHAEWYLRSGDMTPEQVIDGWLAAEEAALAAGYRGLRISGNTYWLEPAQWESFAEYETRVHSAFHGRKIVALCSYSLSHCDSQEVVDVLRNHTVSLVRSPDSWEIVHGATAALAALDPVHGTGLAAPTIIEQATLQVEVERLRAEVGQLVRLDRLGAALGAVTTRLDLVDVLTQTVAPTLEVDALLIVEEHDDAGPQTLVAHGAGIDTLRQVLDAAGSRTLWTTDAALVGAPTLLHAAAALPLTAGGARLGTCVLGLARPRELTPVYRALVQDVVRQVSLSLDRALTYERLEHERERAEHASRAKDEFLAMLGHELRNPLSPILTATQLMRLRSGTEAHDRERVVIERQVKHMIRLVDDLLDVSRITRGKVELRRRAVEVSEIVAQAVELASPALEERRHRLTLDVPASGVVVHADPQRFTQVLCNLLTNAAKYTPPGGEVTLRVSVAASTVTIAVRDNGIGIEPKLLPHIFDLFVQGRQGIDRASGGLGLGLAIARSLLEMHGGTIRAHSDGPGQGSVFTLELPRFANTRPSSGRPGMSGAFAMPVQTRQRRVLVVDDNEDAAFLFSEALRRLGHHVDVAYDGPSALEVARANPPEVAFLDIGLPVMDGYELARRLCEIGVKAPHLIAVTGYGNASDRAKSREAGFHLHLVKPIELAQVQDALAKLD